MKKKREKREEEHQQNREFRLLIVLIEIERIIIKKCLHNYLICSVGHE